MIVQVKDGEFSIETTTTYSFLLRRGDQNWLLTQSELQELKSVVIAACRLITVPQSNAKANGTPVFDAMVSE